MRLKEIHLNTIAGEEDIAVEITKFANLCGLERVAAGRYSVLLLLDLFCMFKEGLPSARVIDEIIMLEEGACQSRLKPPTQFKYPPLRGLWHKHFLFNVLTTIAKSTQIGLKSILTKQVRKDLYSARKEGEQVVRAYIKKITHDMVHNQYERQANAQKLTGEWLIYAEHKGKNYYLCLGGHDKSEGQHENLRKMIDNVACQEFPFLSALLAGYAC